LTQLAVTNSTCLDDKKARRIARQIGLQVIGTVGVLLRAKREGVIAAIQPILAALQEAGFRMSDGLYAETLRLAGEDPSHGTLSAG